MVRPGAGHWHRRGSRRHSQRGSQTVAFLGLMPFIWLVAATVWQLGLLAHVRVAAEAAVWEAAWSAAAAGDPAQARQAAAAAAGRALGDLEVVRLEVVAADGFLRLRLGVRVPVVPGAGWWAHGLRVEREVAVPWLTG